MSWRTTLVLLILAAGLVFYAVVMDAPPREVDARAPLFPGLEKDAVRTVEIRRGERTIAFRKAGETWTMTAPLAAPADTRQVDGLLTDVASLRSEKAVDAQDDAAFGLDAPRLTVRLAGDGIEKTLTVGRETPWAGGFYAKADGSGIVAIPAYVVTRADREPNDFRRRDLVPVEQDDVVGFDIRQGTTAISCRKEEGAWFVTAPRRALASGDDVVDFLSELKRLRVETFADDAPGAEALRTYGLADGRDAPAATLILHLREGDPLTLSLGRPAPGDALGDPPRYARLSDHPFVYTARVKEKDLIRSLDALRADAILPLEGKTITEIRLERDADLLHLKKEGDRWMFTDAEGLPTRRADDVEVHKWLAKFQGLKFRDFAKSRSALGKPFEPLVLLDDSTRRRVGLDAPLARVTFTHKGGAETLILTAPRDGACLALRAGDEIAVRVDEAIAQAARARYIDLRDRTMTDLWSDGAYMLHVRHRDGRLRTVRKRENNKWVADGDAAETDVPHARDLARKLARLPAKRILSQGVPPEPSQGLAAPEVVVQAYYAPPKEHDGDATCTLLLGAAVEDGQRHARIEEDPLGHVFTVEKDLVEKILGLLPVPAAPETPPRKDTAPQ